MQILAHNGGPTAPAAKRDMLGHINRPKDEFGGRGRPPSIFRNGMQILAHDGGPTAPAAAGIMTDHPTRLTLAHPQPVERFNEPLVLFVTICADKQENLFNKKPVQAAILDAWRMATQWRVGLYMLMPNHIHLFCVPGVLNPEPVSKWAAYWKRLSGQYERQLVGVWQRDVWDTQMRTLAQYEEKLSYVRMNPVRKGLVVRPEEWQYSGIVNSIVW
jgi:putative transposase